MSSSPLGITIGIWNSNGIKRKIYELANFMHDENIDIMCISETHLKPPERFFLPNYKSYRWDRTVDKGGGTAILIKKTIKNDAFVTSTTSIENCGATVFTKQFGPISIISAYKPPNSTLDPLDFANILNLSNQCIIAGDLNCKSSAWGCTTPNPNGPILQHIANMYNLEIIAPTVSTHPHSDPNSKCIIDLALAYNVPYQKSISVRQALPSDHLPLILRIETLNTIFISRKFSKINWENFNLDLITKLKNFNRPNTAEEIDDAICHLTDILNKTAETHSEVTIPPSDYHLLPKSILHLLKKRNKARKLFQASRNPLDRSNYLLLKNQASKAISKFRSDSWHSKITSLTKGDRNYWNLIKSFSKPKSEIKPLITPSGIQSTKKEKAETLADSFEDQFTPNIPTPIHQVDQELNIQLIEAKLFLSTNCEDSITPIAPRRISKVIEQLKNKCTPGEDRISNVMLKNLPVIALVILANIFNACLRISHFPDAWKKAVIIPIPKPGKDHNYAVNYRPISLISSLGKLFERLIKLQIDTVIKKEKIKVIPDYQFGFRSSHSAQHQILRVQEKILEGFNVNEYSAAAFLDVAQAFDRVWHDGLLIKLAKLPIPKYLIKLLVDFTLRRAFIVSVDDFFSNPRRIQAGVAQGSVLGPFLFAIYINDIPLNPRCTTALFADDTAIISRSRCIPLAIYRLQEALNQLNDYFSKWRIKINAQKSAAILFYFKRKKELIPTVNVHIGNNPINWISETKYLGIILDARLSFHSHFKKKREKAIRMYCALHPLLKKSSMLPLLSKIHIYKAVIRPIMTYASNCWAHLPPNSYNDLQVAQNQILRWLTGARWFQTNFALHRDLDILRIEDFSIKTAIKFFKDNASHSNPMIQETITYDFIVHQKFPRPKQVLAKGPRPP